ncbi:MAG TPA: hypothetical protein VEC16_00465 [Alphaproteobacteria bacterium]|nr:hypothetical protein [Alphaproteobacteria bacterium]
MSEYRSAYDLSRPGLGITGLKTRSKIKQYKRNAYWARNLFAGYASDYEPKQRMLELARSQEKKASDLEEKLK